jgi:hypothetical protein
MAIVGSARPIESTLEVDDQFHRTYTSVYEVLTNDRTDGPGLILQASGIPAHGSAYVWQNSFDDYAFCTRYSVSFPSLGQTMKKWMVRVTHETPKDSKSGGRNTRQPSSSDPVNGRQSPTDEPWEVSGTFSQFRRAVTKDKDNTPLENTVEEPFVPAIEIDDSRKILTLRKNLPTISLETWVDYSDSVNSNAIWGLQPRQVKLNQWRWQVRFYGPGYAYVENEWEFHISWDRNQAGDMIGWTHEILNEGYRQLVNAASNNPEVRYEEITIKDQPLSKPALLDSDGVLMQHGATPYYNQFKIYKERDFASLGLPDPLPGGVYV